MEASGCCCLHFDAAAGTGELLTPSRPGPSFLSEHHGEQSEHIFQRWRRQYLLATRNQYNKDLVDWVLQELPHVELQVNVRTDIGKAMVREPRQEAIQVPDGWRIRLL